ncbi:hypothetical protein A4R44_03856 [Amycolatopsis sp. M39]|uniref:Uncharacterized protein n=1 Tax=Amycolatopsis rubida TaxID=112413 RepID=A0A1I5ZG12_9PSEU|nr:hypothetical protein A4R44_03856 [Amycolatopsis sp. M39]SFQ55057.1 hypothetical protein SAMN05421854_1156 [Amycolatopsis rubida]
MSILAGKKAPGRIDWRAMVLKHASVWLIHDGPMG